MKSFERAAKRMMIRMAGPLFPARRETKEIEKILLVRVDDRLGNVILLSPTIDWLRSMCPKAKIGLLLSSAFAEIYADDPRVDELLMIDKARQKAFLPVFFSDLSHVANGNYDAVLECSDRNAFSFNSALYARASRAPKRVGFTNEMAANYLSTAVTPEGHGHAAHDSLLLAGALLETLPPPIEECRQSVHLPEPSGEWKSKLDGMTDGAPERIVGVHVGGRGKKRWPIPRFTELAHGLVDAGFRPWIFRGPMEQDVDAAFAEAERRGSVLVPRAGVVEVGQAMARCGLVIGPDTGPMHLASAVGAKTLVLFLSSDLNRHRPINPDDRLIDARNEPIAASLVLETACSILQDTQAKEAR